MRLKDEAIKYILDLQKSMLPLIYCCANKERLKVLENTARHNSGKIAFRDNVFNNDLEKINTLLIFLDEINLDDVLDIEKSLIAMNKEEIVLLEANGIDLLIDKRNLALSILNRYNINVIKGTHNEIESLINFQENNEYDKANKSIQHRYRNFSRKNNSLLIVKSDNYYITDGYSEFIIKNSKFYDKKELDTIYTAMIAVSIGFCRNKGEIVHSILIATIAFYVSQEIAINNNIFDDELINYILDEINNVNIDKIKSYGDIYYCFKGR